MKWIVRSYISMMIAVVFVLTTLLNTPIVEAATFKDINKSSVFVKQKTNYTCTLASSTMLLRRTVMAQGKSSWSSITESKVRRMLWARGGGLYNRFTYAGVKVQHSTVNSNQKSKYISLLKKHPEGVVAYNYGRGGQYHAILLTDYDATTDTFYCADPAPGTAKGRIPLNKSSIVGSNQNQKIKNLRRCWYVVSGCPKLDKTSNEKEVTSIAIIKNPKKTSYSLGQKLDTSGLKLRITYNNGTKKDITKGYVVIPKEGSVLSKRGKQTITVTYTEKNVKKKTTYKIIVK